MAPAVNPAMFGARQAQPLEGFASDARAMLAGLFGEPDPKDLPPLAQAAVEAQARIRTIAARLFEPGSEGEELLEFLCDHAMRRPFLLVQPGVDRDFATLYAAKREGQAEMIYFLLALIAEGRGEQPPQREGASHGTSKRTRRKRSMDLREPHRTADHAGAAGRNGPRKPAAGRRRKSSSKQS